MDSGRSSLKAVVFDIDGTLYRSRSYEFYLREKIAEVVGELLGLDLDEVKERVESIKRRLKTVSATIESLGIDRRRFYEILGERIEPQEFIPRRPELRKVFGELRRAGLLIGCHTNSGKRLLLKVLGCLGLRVNEFDFTVTSDDASPKPSREGYLRILNLTGLQPEEILYVGDRWEVEVKPAKEIGMKTALVYEKIGEPDIFLDDVLELPLKLRELGFI